MIVTLRRALLAFGLISTALAAPPPELARALENLRDQRSYAWEVINTDPGPVAQKVQTRRGSVTAVVQNLSPNIKGQIDRQGDLLISREWADGLVLKTAIATDGSMVTLTPEGWMTDREILTAQADERLRSTTPTPRLQWLRRADRPEVLRPDRELTPLLTAKAPFDFNGESYVIQLRADEAQPGDAAAENLVFTLNLRNGVIRDYEVKMDTSRRVTRARVNLAVSDHRTVIISYMPVTRIDIPDEARAKLKSAKSR